jgi:16S rRNA (uracil1498-N3)-methyltransferase
MNVFTGNYFYTPELDPAVPGFTLNPDESRHVAAVLRLKPGAFLFVTDGRGRLAKAEITAVEPKIVVCRVQEIKEVVEPPPILTVICGYTKHAFEDAVEGLCALGVKTVIPLISQNVQFAPKHPEAMAERFKAKAVSALKQSKTAWLTEVAPFMRLNTMLYMLKDFKTVYLLDPDGGPAVSPIPDREPALMIVGPEGGFTKPELEAFRERGARGLKISSRRLRTELAAIVGAARLL